MDQRSKICLAIIVLLVAVLAGAAADAAVRAAPFSFDSVWFYRDGTRVIPEIGKRWLTVVFDTSSDADVVDFESAGDTFIKEKAEAVLSSHDRLIEYLHDPALAADACFFRMSDGLKLEDMSELINRLNRDGSVKYVHPTVILDNKTFAFFDLFQLEWKTGTGKAERDQLLGAVHVVPDESDGKEKRYRVDVSAIPFFKAVNLLAEDIKVRRATPLLVEIKPSISAGLTLFMSGGNIGDSIPFTLTINFSERVSIDPSSIATLNLRPANLQKELFDFTFDPYDYAKAVTKSPIVITGRMKFYAPGEYAVPAVTISYSCPSCSDSAVRTMETEPVLFRVSSMIPADQSGHRLIVPADAAQPDFSLAALHRLSRRYLWLAVTGFAGLVLCVAGLLRLRLTVTAERERLKERRKEELSADKLRLLLHGTPPAPHWTYLAEVGTLLREYLAALCGIDMKYQGGSGRQFLETISDHLPVECNDSLGIIFAAIDNGVSRESEHYPDIDQLQREILKVVEQTAQNAAAHG